MKKYKRILKHVIALLVIVGATAGIEWFGFQQNIISNGEYSRKFTQAGIRNEKFEKMETDQYITYLLDVGAYVDKISINHYLNANYKYTVSVLKYGDSSGTGKTNSITNIKDQSTISLTKAVTKIEQYADKLIIKISKSGLTEEEQPRVSSITVMNLCEINWFRVAFVFITLCLAYMILFMHRTVTERLEYAFFAISMLMGMLIIVLSPSQFQSWDEAIHFNRAYGMTFKDEIEYSKSAYQAYKMEIPLVNTIEEKIELDTFLHAKNYGVYYIKDKTDSFVEYSKRSYLPQAFGLKLGRTLRFSFSIMLAVGKLCNLLVYSIIFALAIRFAKIGKVLLVCIGLLPTSLFLASTFSYDAFITAFIVLGLTLIFNELTDKDTPMNWKVLGLGVAALLIGSFSKAVYIPLLLIVCFMPKEKFTSKKQRVFFVLAIVVLFLIMMSSFVLPALTNAAGNIDAGGDERGGDTSVTRQIQYILEEPVTFVKLLTGSVTETFGDYFFGYKSRTFFAYMGGNKENLYLISLLVMFFVTLTGDNERILGKWTKAFLGLLMLGVILLIWVALYLDFTPVGANVINGVQQRYYIPLMLPFLLLFSSKKIQCNIKQTTYNRIVLGLNLVVLCGCIYSLILVPYCS
jgi:uncharacterized membrane protein